MGWSYSRQESSEHCGILDKLLPGDVVLADGGFDIADSVGLYCAKLHVPSSTKGKTQLAPQDVEYIRKIANMRIHVERVIGLLQNKYFILNSTVPIPFVTCRPGDDAPFLDKIVTVCCALVNLCNSVVIPSGQVHASHTL